MATGVCPMATTAACTSAGGIDPDSLTGGEVLVEAKVELWQTDHAGHYDIDGFRYRAVLAAEAGGKYPAEPRRTDIAFSSDGR